MKNFIINNLNVSEQEADIILKKFSWLEEYVKEDCERDVKRGFRIVNGSNDFAQKYKEVTTYDIECMDDYENEHIDTLNDLKIGESDWVGVSETLMINKEKYLLVY